MTINLKALTLLPSIMLFILVLHASIAFSDVGMQTLSYMALALVLASTAFGTFLYVRSGRIERFELAVLTYQFILITSSILHATDVRNALYLSSAASLLVFLFSYYRHKYKALIVTLTLAFTLCAYANLLYIFANPILLIHQETESTNAGYLLGNNYNQIGPRLVCAVTCNILCLRYSRWWLVNLIPLTLVSIVTLAIVQSMTSLSCLALLLLLCLLPSRRLQRWCVGGIIVFYVLFQTFVCFGGKGIENNSTAVYIVEEVLHKDITFTNRTEMWDLALRAFAESPVIGFGQLNEEWYFSHMTAQAFGPHNFIISVLLSGGAVLLAIFIYIFATGVVPALRSSTRSANCLLAAIAVLMLMMTMEMYPFFFIGLLLTLAYYFPADDTPGASPAEGSEELMADS